MPRNVLRKRESDMLAVVHWEINGVRGHGKPFPLEYALAWIKDLNERYGAGTHWLEYCDGN